MEFERGRKGLSSDRVAALVADGSFELKTIYYDADKTEVWRELIKKRPDYIRYAATLEIPHLFEVPPHDGKCAIVGASPSVKDHLDEIKTFQENEMIISLNGAHNWLVKNGVPPRIHVFFEVDVEDVEVSTGGPPHKDTYYYVCSHCPDSIFNQLEGHRRVLWHCFDEPPEYQAMISKLFPGEFMVGGGFVTFFRAVNLAAILGYREFHLYGCDCSFEGDNSHYDGYRTQNVETKLVVAAGTKENYRIFTTNPSLSFLASEVIRFCDTNQRGIKIKVHGDGLLRHLHQMEYPGVYLES
jgi:Protein of unknown function DUF115